jgi:spore coat protein JB
MDKQTKESLMRRVQELSFAKVECELYLDTHPDSREALDYYKNILSRLDEAMTTYQNEYGPIFSEGVVGDRWTWVEGAWPWQLTAEDK